MENWEYSGSEGNLPWVTLHWPFSKGHTNVVEWLEIRNYWDCANYIWRVFLTTCHPRFIAMTTAESYSHNYIMSSPFEMFLVYKKRRIWKKCSTLEKVGVIKK